MEYSEAMQALEQCGSEQTRKIYMRHGAPPDNLFGVKFADLDRIAKRIKRNHPLAQALWRSGNYDARNLAVKVCEPQEMQADELQQWAEDAGNYMHAGFVGEVASRSPAALQMLGNWTASEHEFVKNAGFSLLGSLAKARPDDLEDARAAGFIAQIEREIHASPNWARYGMNWALISVGTYKQALTQEAVDAAGRIGKVEVDHGQTNCKTPDAAPYIRRAAEHIKRKRARR